MLTNIIVMLSICLHAETSNIIQDLVPCTLLSFEDEQILMLRGQNWKSMYPSNVPTYTATKEMSDVDVSGTFKLWNRKYIWLGQNSVAFQ